VSTLRVAVDARPLDIDYLRTQGIGRYAHSLLGPLSDVAAERGGELVLLRSARPGERVYEGDPPSADQMRVWRPPLPIRAADLPEQVLLPLDVRRARAAAYHALSIYRTAPTRGVPTVVTVHDVIPLMWPDLYLRTGMVHRLLYRAASRASELIAVSEAAREDVVSHLGVPPERVSVVPEAAAPHFSPDPGPSPAERLGVAQPYVLYVGGLTNTDPRKDVEALIDAFADWSNERERPETLVLCGRLGPGGRPLVERARATGARTVFTDFVPDPELPALMTGARCLVTATRYEGFGLPALEAISCGTPVVAYEAGAIPEVAGRGALLAPLGQPAALMAALERVCDDAELRDRLGREGREHAHGFTWRRAAELTWDVYERAAR
jgi:glycosyltransferase involved in cell wall biosynthesis